MVFKNLCTGAIAGAIICALPMTASAESSSSSMLPTYEAPQAETSQRCTGTVVDDDGEPVIGATVKVEGTSLVTSTNVDGRFTLNGVKQGAKLTITFIGCKPETVTWNGNPIEITLTADNTMLDEVVVVGYGTQKKVNVTGAVSQVKGEELSRRPVGDAAQMLQGMVPGLFVSNSNSGRPGGSATLQLRGQGNLSGTGSPYILVDGVEMDLSDVNPNDIESISVLKDAGASAIYGARAAYGVILVTTKRGEEGKMRVSYQGTVGWNQPTTLPKMLDSYEFAKYWNVGVVNAGMPGRMYSDEKIELLRQFIENPASVNPWQELSPSANMNPAFENSESGIGNTDYFKLHYKDWAFKQNHNISASGGGKRAQYYISLGYYGEDGILRYADIDYKRYNFATNILSEITKWLKVRANTKFVHTDTNTPFGTGGISEGFYHSLARFRPTVHYIDPNGNFTELSMIPYLQSGTYTTTKRDRLSLTFGMDVTPLKGWKITGDYTYKYMGVQHEALNVAPDIYAADGVTTSKGQRDELGARADGRYLRQNGVTRYQNFSVYTSYNFTVAEKNEFSVMVGYQSEENRYSFLQNYVDGLYSTTTPGLGLASGDVVASESRNSWATRGFYGRLTYNFDSRYLFEFDIRRDGTSRFAKNNRWGTFPSIALGWNIANEQFMESTRSWLNQLKLRASWGQMGNQAGAGLYTFAETMGITPLGSYFFQNGREARINAPGVSNPFITWEKVTSKNLGLDFGFFNGALSGTFEVFQRDTKDMLGPGNDYPDFFGASAPQANNANLRNRGWELQVNWTGRIGKDISYNIGGSISDATAVVTKYSNPTFTNPAGNWYEGRAVGEIWGLRSAGILQNQAEADAFNSLDLSYLNGGVWGPGDQAYVDLNGDGKINRGTNVLGDMGDFTIIGNTTPRYQFTINAGISWKGLHLNMMWQGIGKRNWDPGTQPYFWGWGAFAQVTLFEQHLDYWTEDNPNAYYTKPYIHNAGGIGTFNNRNRQTTDRYLQNASYGRLKNLTLAYDLPRKWVNHIGLNKVQVFFTGENLWTITPLAKMYDPEAIFTANGYTGEGGKNYPMNRVISFGLTLNL